MLRRISLDRHTDFLQGFDELSEEMFKEGQVSWSRIITFFAFGARVARFCVDNDMSEMVIEVVSTLSILAVDKLTPFIRDHGGWVRFCDF